MVLFYLLFLSIVTAYDCTQLCRSGEPVCKISNMTVLCDSALSISTSTQILIFNSTLYCVDLLNKGEPVSSIVLRSKSIVLEKSRLVSSLLELHGEAVTISEGSVLDANGTGYIAGTGNAINSNDAPSYAGRGGGTCGEPSRFLTYGDQYDPRGFYGSGGMHNYKRGGGIITVEAGSLSFSGLITASGDIPLSDPYLGTPDSILGDLNGGTGGSIYVNVSASSGTGKIIAAGGSATGRGYGGGGGRVAIYGPFSPKVIAPGGSGLLPRCPEGGAGTIYFSHEDTLVIDNSQTITRNPTPVSTRKTMNLLVRNGASVSPIFSHAPIVVKKLELSSSRLEASQVAGTGFVFDSVLKIESQETFLLGKSAIGRGDVESMEIITGNLTIETSSGIYFGSRLRVDAQKVELKGAIEGNLVVPDTCSIIITADVFMQKKASSMKAEKIGVLANSLLIEGTIQASQQNCTETEDYFDHNPPFHYVVGNVSQYLKKDDLPELLNSNFTHLLIGKEVVIVEKCKILGSRVAIFGEKISIEGVVSASGYGCSSDMGIGKGDAKEKACAGSGAGYGGRGGNGRVMSAEYAAICQGLTDGGRVYSTALNPWFEGSGGGSAPIVGGAGGGFIDIEATSSLNISGVISADGEDAPRDASSLWSGSGGGSGGGIFIRTRTLVGLGGKISAAGGRGTVYGGGGGGGRILISWIGDLVDNHAVNTPNHSLNWEGNVEVIGGMPGELRYNELIGFGSNGSLQAETCRPGSAGFLCRLCGIGYYKPGYQYEEKCRPCVNKPESARYIAQGEPSVDCQYECPDGYTLAVSNPYCRSPLQEFFEMFGGVAGTLGVTLAALTLIALFALLVINACSKWRKRSLTALQHRLLSPLDTMNQYERKLPMKKAEHPDLTREDLPFHERRMFLLGDNTYYRPWCLPKTPSPDIEAEVVYEQFAEFAKQINNRTRWFLWQHITCLILLWIYHPLGLLAIRMTRKRKCQDVKDFIQFYNESMWRKIEARQLANSLRFSSSDDYTLAYLDITSFSKKIEEWDERPNLPLTLLAAGDGSFYNPFHLDTNDLMLQLIGWKLDSDSIEDYQLFVHQFNQYLRTIRLAAPLPNRKQRELLHLQTLVAQYNELLFHNENYHAILALFQAPLVAVRGKYVENTISAGLNSGLLEDYSSDLRVEVRKRLYSFKLGLIFTENDIKNAVTAPRAGGLHYESNTTALASDPFLEKSGICSVSDPEDSASFTECSLRGLLLVPEMWNQHIVLFILSLLVLLDIVRDIQTMKLLLLLDFFGNRNVFGFVMFGSVMPGVNIITPVLGIVTVWFVSFQIVCCSSTIMTSIYLVGMRHNYWFWVWFLLAQLLVKVASIRFAVMYKANVEAISFIEVRSYLEAV